MEVPTLYQDGAQINLSLEEAMPLQIEVYNLLGQKISTVFQGQIGAGKHEFELSIPAGAEGLLLVRALSGASGNVAKIWKK